MNPLSIAGGIAQGLISGLTAAALSSKDFATMQKAASQTVMQAGKSVTQSFYQVADAGVKAGSATKVMGGAFDVLVSTIGTAFTPIIFKLATWFLNLADLVKDKLIPAIEEWYMNLNKGAREGGRAVGETVGGGAGAIAGAKLGAGIGAAIPVPGGTLIGAGIGAVGGYFAGKYAGGEIGEKAGNALTGQGYRTGPAQPLGLAKNNQNEQDILAEMRINLGRQGNVGFSGIADVWKQVQMKAFMSPFERKLLDLQIDALKAAERTAQNTDHIVAGADLGIQRVGGNDKGRVGKGIGGGGAF